MNNKFKSLTACLMLALCFTFTACVTDPASYYFDYDELKEKVVTIELINYDNSNAKSVKKKADILPFDFDKMEILETLESEKYDNFLSDFSKIFFFICDDMTRYINSAAGISVRITYESGNFIIFCLNEETNFVCEFTESGDVDELILYYVASTDYATFAAFIDLFNKYFNTHIDY